MRKVVVFLGLLIVLGAAGCQRDAGAGIEGQENGADGKSSSTWEQQGTPTGEDARAVQTVTISRGSLNGSIVAIGLVEGIREVEVASETQGTIVSVLPQLGERVERGDVLVGLDDSIEKLTYEQATAQLESARLELSATENLYERGSASKVALARSRAAARGAAAAAARALKAYRDRTITAPISGYIASLDNRIAAGNYLSAGQRVVRIVDTRSLKSEVSVSEHEVRHITTESRAEVELADCGDGPLPARVAAIAAGADSRTGSFTVIVSWENSCGEAVKSGMSVTVRILPQEARETLLVPVQALLTRQGETSVLVVENGNRVSLRRVEVGKRLGNRAEVISGLSEGEEVVISGLSNLTDGDSVTPSNVGWSSQR